MKKTAAFALFQAKLVPILMVGVFVGGWYVGRHTDVVVPRLDRPVAQNQTLPSDLDYQSVEEVYDTLRSRYDGSLSASDLEDGLKQGLARATGDPYTEFFNGQEATEFTQSLEGRFSGIGAELGKEGDQIIVIAPLDSYPAQRAGIQPRDAILKIDEHDTFGMTISEAVSKIRGEAGTTVRLTLARAGEIKEVSITREVITVPSVKDEVIADGKVGVIRISRFGDDTTTLAQEAARRFRAQGIDRVVLDLRNNPGGRLPQAVSISNIWLPQGTLVTEERRGDNVRERLLTREQPILEGVRTIVLVNEGSASASEIVAGALKDNGAATLMGSTTFGKGSVQDLIPLRTNGVLKVTIARWFTPSGKNIDKEGLAPDIEVTLTDAERQGTADIVRDRAVAELLK